MGKGGIGKKSRAGPSLHSRAARRATSPGIDTDKSLKEVQPPSVSANQRPAVLAAHHTSGVSKKTKQGRKSALSFKARRRQERGMDRAANVVDRTLQRVQRSKGQARSLHSRRRTWEEVNDDALDRTRLPAKRAAKMREQEAVRMFFAEGGEMELEGDGMDDLNGDSDAGEDRQRQQLDQDGDVEVPTDGITNISLLDAAASIPLPEVAQVDDGDEIL